MQYRKFGELDWRCSALGFGCARLPQQGEDQANIDVAEAVRMIRYAIDNGVNYIDTAYNYHGGNSERVVGIALRDGFRDKVKLATKLFWPAVDTADDFDRLLSSQLERLQTNFVDVYMLHAMSARADSWPKLRDLGVLDWAEGAMADGRVGCLGFSFHDSYDVFREIVDAYDGWAMCQIQYNLMDIDNQAGTEGLQYADSKGLAVVIMEPLLGGKLANPPEAVQRIWEEGVPQRTHVDSALRWLWNQPEVSVVLSGMSTMKQVEQNVASAGASGIDTLTAQELATIDRVREEYITFRAIPCTQCRYCMPCPNGVDIPRSFELYNYGLLYSDPDSPRWWYTEAMPADNQADKCIQCRECEDKCTQQIEISEWMPVVHAVLGEDQPYPE